MVADRIQIQQVVVNLVTNAMQAMDGLTDARLTLGVRGRDDGWQVVSVADTGPGIPEDDLTEVLEPLFTTKPCGIGLGLAIVQRIMERHGGGLEITSEKRRGTRARLWLPTDHDQEEAAPR